MRKYIFKIAPIIFLTFTVFSASAQTETTLSFMDNVYQSTYNSPFNDNAFKVSVGLPGLSSVHLGLVNSGFTYRDAFPNKDNFLSHSTFLNSLRTKEFVGFNTQVDLFHLFVRAGNQAFSFHVNENIRTKVTYPGDLFRMALNGNGQFAGGEANFSDLGMNLMHYREYALGYYRNEEKWQFGGHLKLLAGMANVNTKKSNIKLEISDDIWQHKATGDFVIQSGGFDFEKIIDDPDEDSYMKYALNMDNLGAAVDLGASYQLFPKLQLNAAASNLGAIRWKEGAQTLNIKEEIAFEGVDFLGVLLKDSINKFEENFEKYVDDLLPDTLDADTVKGSYWTATPWNISMGARYELVPGTYAVGRIALAGYKGVTPHFTLGFYHDLFRWFNIGITNNMQYRNWFNPGLGIVLKPGPFQFYVVGDNLMAAKFLTANNVNIRFGMNLVFGRLVGPEKVSSVLK